jgi:hypothetical protein
MLKLLVPVHEADFCNKSILLKNIDTYKYVVGIFLLGPHVCAT